MDLNSYNSDLKSTYSWCVNCQNSKLRGKYGFCRKCYKSLIISYDSYINRASEIRQERLVGPGITESEWQLILKEFNNCCAYCHVKCDNMHKDHVVPISKGGTHDPNNILPACPCCNRKKHAKVLFELVPIFNTEQSVSCL